MYAYVCVVARLLRDAPTVWVEMDSGSGFRTAFLAAFSGSARELRHGNAALAGVNPVWVIASHEPGIEPCRHISNDVLDA